MSRVLVWGNGFDLDFGLKTRYIDFWRSDAFRGNSANIYTGLIQYLNSNNEASRIEILRQLREMNEKRVKYMYGQNEFSFIRTSVEEDKPKLMKFLNNLLML